MEIKTIKPFQIFYYSERTNFAGMMKLVRVKARELYREAAQLDLEITGPIYWIYNGVDGNPETEFTLEIGLPIQKTASKSEVFGFKRLENFKCVALTHLGIWDKMPESYGKLMGEIQQNGQTMNGICREIYLNMDFENPENNITEIQIGLF